MIDTVASGGFTHWSRGVPIIGFGDGAGWMEYSGRPVFPFEIDWATVPVARMEVALNTVDPGFGDVTFWKDQEHVIHGWQFGLPLVGEQVAVCEQFFDALRGRLHGFWIQTPVQAFRVVAGSTTSVFLAADRQGAENVSALPALYVSFTKRGQDTQRGKVASIVDEGDGTERVTLTEALSVGVDATWQAWVLAYVRLSDDTERGNFDGEGLLYRTFRVVELPHEYTALETSQRPVFFYLFETKDGGATVQWRQTSFAWDIDDGTDTWSARKITHGSIRRSIDVGREELSIEAEFEDTSPLYQMVPPALAMPLYLTVYEADFATPESKSVLFTGRIIGPCELEGKTIKAKAGSVLDIIGASTPAMQLQQRCNYRLFEPATCRVLRGSYEDDVVLTSIVGRVIVITGAALAGRAANWYAEGFIETGAAQEFERRTILSSTAAVGTSVTITLNAPLYYAAPADGATVLPGCDGTPDTCITKFSNFRNFGGHRFAFRNLTLKALETPEIAGGKK